MTFVRQYSDQEREAAVGAFVDLLGHGYSITSAGNRVRERYGVSRQRVREWAEDMGYELTPSCARLQQLQSENYAMSRELEKAREVTEQLRRDNARLRRQLEGMSSAL